MSTKSYDEIYGYVSSLAIVDSHEHVMGREEQRDKNADILSEYLIHYIDTEMMSAGMTWAQRLEVIDSSRPVMERWRIAEPFWEMVRNTGHARSLDLAVQGVYGAPRIDGSTIEELNRKFRESLNGGQYRKVFKDLSNIEFAVLDMYDSAMDYDPEYFRGVFHVDSFLNPLIGGNLGLMEKKRGIKVRTLEDWLTVTDLELNTALSNGALGFKSAIAYSRSIFFTNPSRQEAEQSLRWLLENRDHMTPGGPCSAGSPCRPETRPLEDYMVHHILRYAEEHGLIFQIHTGAQGPNWRRITDTDPGLLFDLLAAHPDVRFDLFHSGFPYQGMSGAIAQMYPNAFVDMCWTHMMNPKAARNMLAEWLDNVPANKIIGFGGDYALVDGIYGHQLLARRNVSRVLADRVEEGVCDIDTAKWLAKRLLHDNGADLYRRK